MCPASSVLRCLWSCFDVLVAVCACQKRGCWPKLSLFRSVAFVVGCYMFVRLFVVYVLTMTGLNCVFTAVGCLYDLWTSDYSFD